MFFILTLLAGSSSVAEVYPHKDSPGFRVACTCQSPMEGLKGFFAEFARRVLLPKAVYYTSVPNFQNPFGRALDSVLYGYAAVKQDAHFALASLV